MPSQPSAKHRQANQESAEAPSPLCPLLKAQTAAHCRLLHPLGALRLHLIRAPPVLVRAASSVQRRWRTVYGACYNPVLVSSLLHCASHQHACYMHIVYMISLHAMRIRVSVCVCVYSGVYHALHPGTRYLTLFKRDASLKLGLSFSPRLLRYALVATVRVGPARGLIGVGDLVSAVDGVACASPAHAAQLLRAARGAFGVVIVPAEAIDVEELSWCATPKRNERS